MWRQANSLTKMVIISIVNGITSDEFVTKFGGPQGITQMIEFWRVICNTMFAPLRHILPDALFDLWGDDSKAIVSAATEAELVEKIEKFYRGMIDWCHTDRCHLHPEKSKFLVFAHNKERQQSADLIQVNIQHPQIRKNIKVRNANTKLVNGEVVEDGATYLGIHFDPKLNFKKHIARKVKSGEKIVSLMKMVAGKLSHNPPLRSKTLLAITKQKLTPTLHFGSEVWDMCPQTYKKTLNGIHRNALALCRGVTSVGLNYLAICIHTGTKPLHIERDINTMRTYVRLQQTMKQSDLRAIHERPIRRAMNKPDRWAPYSKTSSTGKGHVYPTRRPGARGVKVGFTQRAKVLLQSYKVDLNPSHMQKIDLKTRHQKVIQYQIPCAKKGMPVTSKYGNSSTRVDGDEKSVEALNDFLEVYNKIPEQELKIFTDGSYFKKNGDTGASSVWYQNNTIERHGWPVSANGSNILGEMCAFRNSLYRLVTQNYRDQQVHFFIDCANVVSMFTTWSKPKDNIDIVDTTRMYIKVLQERGVELVLHWIPSHVKITGNDEADTKAKLAANEAGLLARSFPNFGKSNGISYTVAKTKIKRAANLATLERWNATNTVYKHYNNTISPALYQDLGTPAQVRFRNAMMLGVDYLNCTKFKYGRGVLDPYCPCCPKKEETVSHFLCFCPRYSGPRQKLYDEFEATYLNDRIFNTYNLMHEHSSRQARIQHAPVIAALNAYITEALELRSVPCDKWSLFEAAWSSM